ncbi:MAG: hypothetical protein IKC05_09600 [Lentisphaeria bacterium]|nr:hypothetical protein [Lentisphaeria bacterium]
MRFLLILTSLAAAALLTGADILEPYRARAEKIVYGTPEDFQLGKELCAVFKKLAAQRKPVFKSPLFISQFVPHRVGQLSHTETQWNDRQLFCDRRHWVTQRTDFQLPSIIKNFEDMKEAGYDGTTTWTYPGYRRAWIYYLQAANKVGNFKIFPGGSPGVGEYSRMETSLGKELYKNPAILKLAGVPLIRGYYSDRGGGLSGVENYLANIKKATGGKGVKYLTELFMIHSHKRLSREERKNFQNQYSLHWQKRQVSGKAALLEYDYITEFLRQKSNGGVCYGPYMHDQALKFPTGLYEDYILPLFAAALAQPEFNGKKIFSANFKCGYTNAGGSQTLNRDGTKTLRRNLETFLKFKPDILIGSEWDELNEDTSLGPTVVRPMSSSRITRYYSAISKGKKPSPMPGDDLSIPNMIISQRRELYYGSEFELELLNVPDGEKSQKYSVKVKLLDENGKTVYTSNTLSFDSGKMMDHTIRLNTAKLTQYRLLAPEITVSCGGNEQIFASGLPFTVMRPAVCDDHSWYCTPLRNLLKAVSAKVDFKKQNNGQVHVKAQLDFKEKLNSVEILQNVYSMQILDPCDEFGTADGSKQLFLLTLTNVTGKKTTLSVDVNVDSAVAFSIPLDTREQALGEIFPVQRDIKKQFTKIYFVVNKNELSNVALSVKGKDFNWTLPLNKLKTGDVISHANAYGVTAVLQNTPRAFRCALPMDHGKVNWKTTLPATLPEGVMVLRAVSQNGKVWYSQGCPLGRTAEKGEKQLALRGLNEFRSWQSFTLPASRVPVIDYEFDSANGATLRTKAGREYYAQLGGHAQLASDQNGNRNDSKPGLSTILNANLKKSSARPAPVWKKEDGRNYLHFDGKSGSFIMLPRTAVPQYSGFHLTMEIRPVKFTARQVLWCHYNTYPNGFELHLENGKLCADPIQRRPHDLTSPFWQKKEYKSDLKLVLGKWNKVEMIYDGKALTLGVNGKYKSFAHDGVPRWMSVSTFGGWNNEMFHGDLRKLTITPALPSK